MIFSEYGRVALLNPFVLMKAFCWSHGEPWRVHRDAGGRSYFKRYSV